MCGYIGTLIFRQSDAPLETTGQIYLKKKKLKNTGDIMSYNIEKNYIYMRYLNDP